MLRGIDETETRADEAAGLDIPERRGGDGKKRRDQK
jgi:hypothetical protein